MDKSAGKEKVILPRSDEVNKREIEEEAEDESSSSQETKPVSKKRKRTDGSPKATKKADSVKEGESTESEEKKPRKPRKLQPRKADVLRDYNSLKERYEKSTGGVMEVINQQTALLSQLNMAKLQTSEWQAIVKEQAALIFSLREELEQYKNLQKPVKK